MVKKILLAIVVARGRLRRLCRHAAAGAAHRAHRPPSRPRRRRVFPHVNELKAWDAWSPWAKLDPNAKTTFEGPASGNGAVFAWSGNDEVGEGKMTILDSRPDEAIKIKTEFIKPFPGSSTSGFTFKPEGDKTVVTWNMRERAAVSHARHVHHLQRQEDDRRPVRQGPFEPEDGCRKDELIPRGGTVGGCAH